MEAVGDVNAPLLIVMLNKPKEGQESWFYKLLEQECKLPITDCRFVYMLNEAPKGLGNKAKKEQTKQSWDRFEREITESNPKVVLALGSQVLYYLTGIKENITDSRGYVLTSKYFRDIEWEKRQQIGLYKTSNKKRGITKGDPRFGNVVCNFPGLLDGFTGIVIPSFAIEFVCAGFTVKSAFKEDICKIRRILNDDLILIEDLYDFENHYTTIIPEIDVFRETELIAVDIETHGKDNDVIDCVSFSDGKHTYSVTWNHNTLAFIKELFRLDKLFVFHNSPFDVPRLRAAGVDTIDDKKLFDTMFGAVTLQPDLTKGLGRVATVYLDCEPWKWDTLKNADPVYYSAKDAFMTAWIARQEIKVMKSLGVWDLFMGTGDHPGPGVMQTIPVLTDMTREGIKTNRVHAEWWVDKLERRLLKYHQLWSKMFADINPQSSKQIQHLLYEIWDLPIQKSKKGHDSSDELSLVKLKNYIMSSYAIANDTGPWCTDPRCNPRTFDLILAMRDCAKTISTYVQPVAMNQIARVHPSYLPASKDDDSFGSGAMHSKGNTSTGRLATYSPNIGNQPKKVRKIYVVDSELFCFIQFDWKAAELYAFAFGSGDKRLLDDLRSSDLHLRNADRFGTTRDTAKNIIYASQYLAGPTKVNEMILAQEHTYVPVAECKRIMDGLKNYYHRVTALKNHLINLCETKHYIKNPFGRIRFFHNNEAPAAVDFYAQSIVADCLWCILKPMSDKAKEFGGRLVTTVYDSVLVQVPKDKMKEAIVELKKIMETPFPNVAPEFYLPCEVEVGLPGASWGELKKEKYD